MWKQLVKANPPGKGVAGACLAYARSLYGIGAKYQTAWSAWSNTQFKHTNRIFPGVDVPLWFRHPASGTSPGHVVVRMADGRIFSSPTSGTGYRQMSTIEEVEKHYSSKYVGWSEDINGVRVAQEEESVSEPADYRLNKGDIVNGFAIFKRTPTQADFDAWIGQTHKKFWYDKIAPGVKEMSVITPTQVDKTIKMGLLRPATEEELNNPNKQSNPGQLIDEVWGSGGEANYNSGGADFTEVKETLYRKKG